MIDKIIAVCANHEVYDLAKVEYVVFDNDENKQSMREQILKHIADKIAFYHDLHVQDEIEIIQINEVNNEYYPLDRYQNYTAFSSSSFEVLEHNSKKQKDIHQLTKNNSIFYDPLSTKHFDIILNPGILEPTVQYTATLTVNYTLPIRDKEEPLVKEKIVEKKEYILISPNGDTKVLQL